jgi:hypothetical protein
VTGRHGESLEESLDLRPRPAAEGVLTCEVCGVTFTARRRHAKTCSVRCRKWRSRLNVYLRKARTWSWVGPKELPSLARRFRETYWPKIREV